LVGKGKMFIKDEAEVASRVSGVEDRQTDIYIHTRTHTDARDHNALRVVYDSREM